ncbi:hypothetical protein STEG23_035890, partial [Scotinomys teguina]
PTHARASLTIGIFLKEPNCALSSAPPQLPLLDLFTGFPGNTDPVMLTQQEGKGATAAFLGPFAGSV